jgi:hypothetical protein
VTLDGRKLKIPKQAYTLEFKELAVKHLTLGDRSPRQFLMHWISQPHQEKLVA